MGASVAALVAGFAGHRPDVPVAAVILNRVGSPRHEAELRRAIAPLGLPVLGAVPRLPALALPRRHLGLVQAAEQPDLEGFLAGAAAVVAATIDLAALAALARPLPPGPPAPGLAPPGQRIALARDSAFAFAYPHQLADWRRAGAAILPFSPLADEPPDPAADAVFLPGGYPELHAGRLAAAARFRGGMAAAAAGGARIYGECGGFMVLGRGLVDAGGQRHAMLGLLDLETSFAERRLHLGYRRLATRPGAPLSGRYRGHEFHYATILRAEGAPLFAVEDAGGAPLPDMGLYRGRVAGSFAHIIDAA
jgi:cobyrinic acid a,c-diamide synthase